MSLLKQIERDFFSTTPLGNTIKVAPDVWAALLREVQPVEHPRTCFGLTVVVDHDLQPGEWKMVP
jgi:hypothetical protein